MVDWMNHSSSQSQPEGVSKLDLGSFRLPVISDHLGLGSILVVHEGNRYTWFSY